MRTLYHQKWYTPMEVAKQGFIQNSKGDEGTVRGRYNYILELIGSGKLAAKNYSTGNLRPNYLISEKAITNYHKREEYAS